MNKDNNSSFIDLTQEYQNEYDQLIEMNDELSIKYKELTKKYEEEENNYQNKKKKWKMK